MARDEMARESDVDESLLNRRSYLKLAGAAAASVASFGSSAAAQDDSFLVDVNFENTEYRDLYTGGDVDWKTKEYEALVNEPVRSGDSALEIHFPEGNHDGRGAWIDPVEANLTDEPLRELYASYWVYFPEDFVCANGEGKKLPGPINYFEDWSETDSNGDGHGGDSSRGYGWSAREYFWDDTSDEVEMSFGVYHMDQDTTYGEQHGQYWLTKGKWHNIQQYIKLNTTDSSGNANRDGVLKKWVNGSLEYEKNDFRFTNYPEEGVKYGLTTWYGGSTPSPTDQSIFFDNWKLSTSSISIDDPTNPEGTVFELIADEGLDTTSYQFTVEGSVSKNRYAGDLSAEGNDSITDNGDGTVTVNGAAGNGYGDSYYVDGTFTSIDIDESNWTLRYGDEEVNVSDLVDTPGPEIDRFNVNKSEQLGNDRMFSVQWAVSAVEEELETVEVVASEAADDLNFAVNDANGENASGWDLFQFPVGTELDVTLRAKDVAENVTKETKNITL